jgi:Uma2 family endonuclease
MQAASCQRLELDNIDWQGYCRLLRVFERHPSVRLTYDRGKLEIMSPRLEHETPNHLLGRFVIVLTEELALPIRSGGSTTYRRRSKKRGLEPDNSYWIAHEPAVRGKRRLNLKIDPPPDLAIEIDVTNSSLDRMGIYASLKVPEVWRLDDDALTFHVLGADGKYAESAGSLSFPGLKSGDLQSFLVRYGTVEENALVGQFRAWVRQRIVDSWN